MNKQFSSIMTQEVNFLNPQLNQRAPFAQTGKQWVAYEKTHC